MSEEKSQKDVKQKENKDVENSKVDAPTNPYQMDFTQAVDVLVQTAYAAQNARGVLGLDDAFYVKLAVDVVKKTFNEQAQKDKEEKGEE